MSECMCVRKVVKFEDELCRSHRSRITFFQNLLFPLNVVISSILDQFILVYLYITEAIL